MSDKKTAIVILNWNGRKIMEQFLPSVVENSSSEAEIIIADNASTDDSLDFLKKNYPQLRTIVNDKNYGFAEGYNRALEQVDADYFILLNSDVEVTPNWIAPVIEYMEEDEKRAICQPKLLSYHNRDTFEYAGGAGGFIDHLGYPFCRGRMFTTVEKDQGQYNDPCEVFWATGAAMFVKADVYKQLGGLDNDFFAHMEEIDFCWRAKNNGYKVCYCPDSTIYHVGGGTLPPSSPFKTFLNFRNNFALLFKNLQRHRLLYVLPLRVVLDYVAASKFLLEGKPREFTAVVKAHWKFYAMLGKLRKKRNCLPHRNVNCIYHRSIVWDYYIGKKQTFNDLNKNRF